MSKGKIRKILIANRGEIAVRIMRTCRELGIQCVAVYSEADRTAYHVRMADEAYCIGPPPATESYLKQEHIIEVAKSCGADAIHPGYGFLAENPEFAEQVQREGLIFIGPPAEAMRVMGDKTAARQAMAEAGVPVVPGSPAPLNSVDEALQVADQIGFPVLLKAAAGGGGKGMRIVSKAADMASAFRAAASEAKSAFGDGRIYIEKYLENPRHIEFQIIADHDGRVVHLGERECSIQRRHQKVIEESPSVIMTAELRKKMGEAAVKAAAACGYTNAGTVEFLVDKDRRFYFLEMNTRLQVEHPVTEMVVGHDLVHLQIEIAMGKPLPFTQKDIRFQGHAIECRVYAEDPDNQFMPSTGTIEYLHKPDGPGIRDDAGVTEGDEISLYYDPMIAKLIVHAADREAAIRKMLRALDEYRIVGVKTTIPFCRWVLQHPEFQKGTFDTHFVQKHYQASQAAPEQQVTKPEQHAAAIALAYLAEKTRMKMTLDAHPANHQPASRWKLRGWKHLQRT